MDKLVESTAAENEAGEGIAGGAALPSSDILHVPMKDDMKEETPPAPDVGACPSYTPPLGADEGGRMKGVISSAEALVRARERVGDAEAGQLWGLHVRARAVTQIVGETSAGKTVFLHNLGHHLASGKEFLGIAPPRPLRVLHVDFESYHDILVEHLDAIGTVDGWDFLDLEELEKVERGSKLVDLIEARVRTGHYDVVIIDPLMEAYPVRDENDNALAEVQMQAFRRLARGTGAGVVLAHNSGLRTARKTKRGKEGIAESKYLGRGATNRVDRVDVSINFTAPTEGERLLHVSKSRAKNFGERLRVRFAGKYGYELVESSSPTEGVIAKMQADVLTIAREEAAEGRILVERKTFVARLNIEKGTAREQTLDRALKRNVEKDRTLHRMPGGGYSLTPSAEGSEVLQVETADDGAADAA